MFFSSISINWWYFQIVSYQFYHIFTHWGWYPVSLEWPIYLGIATFFIFNVWVLCLHVHLLPEKGARWLPTMYWTQDLWKNSQCSYLMSHLANPHCSFSMLHIVKAVKLSTGFCPDPFWAVTTLLSWTRILSIEGVYCVPSVHSNPKEHAYVTQESLANQDVQAGQSGE